jgi:hypothetical protein
MNTNRVEIDRNVKINEHHIQSHDSHTQHTVFPQGPPSDCERPDFQQRAFEWVQQWDAGRAVGNGGMPRENQGMSQGMSQGTSQGMSQGANPGPPGVDTTSGTVGGSSSAGPHILGLHMKLERYWLPSELIISMTM